MENANVNPPGNIFTNGQVNLPNATAVLILGIISIAGCCCGGILGLICGIIAIILANKDQALYAAAPGNYTPSSYNNLKAGRICAIIGTILSALYTLWTIFIISKYGMQAMSNPDVLREMMNK